MKWSQLKTRVEALFADAVKGRVALRTTRYRKAHDTMGRAWITLDGAEIVNMCSYAEEIAHWREARRLQQETGCTDYLNPEHKAGYYAAFDEAKETLRRSGVFSPHEFHQALFDYLNLPVEQILASPDPVTRAIGMLDRRVGLRRLASVDVAHEHPLVRRLHEFRCEAEGATANAGGNRPAQQGAH